MVFVSDDECPPPRNAFLSSVYGNPYQPVPDQHSLNRHVALFSGSKCIDGSTDDETYEKICSTKHEKYPFLALEYEDPIEVYKVIIYNRGDCCGHRLANVRVIVTDKHPYAFEYYEETVKGTSTYYIFKGHPIFPYQFQFLGDILGTYEGPASTKEVIPIVSKKPLTGKYVVIQLMSGEPSYLSLNEVKVWCSQKGEVCLKILT